MMGDHMSHIRWQMAVAFFGALLVVGCDDPEATRLRRMPTDEQAFIELLSRHARTWANAPNDIAREPLRAQRKEELCRNPPSVASDWLATVRDVGTAWPGNTGKIEVAISSNISLYSIDIARDSNLFSSMAALQKKQNVRVSGKFFVGDSKDCLRETRLTQEGGMLEPRFAFQFTAITPL